MNDAKTPGKRVYIYLLIDTRNYEPFYLGVTRATDLRLYRHVLSANKADPRNPGKNARILEIEQAGRVVHLEVIQVLQPGEDWEALERAYIAHYRSRYPGFTNIHPGGRGYNPQVKANPTVLTCHHCGREYNVPRTIAPRSRFCSATCRGSTFPDPSKPIEAVSPEGQVFYYPSALAFSKEHPGFSRGLISQVCNGTRKTHKGWVFRFRNP